MPIVFCASLVPCPSEYSAAETSCSTLKDLSTRRGSDRRNSHDSATVSSSASMNPITGATTMKTSVLVQPLAMIAENAALAAAAPAYPPINACDDEVGRPSHQVTRSQMIAPSNPPSPTVASPPVISTRPFPTVLAH